jgi:hypothetical protein
MRHFNMMKFLQYIVFIVFVLLTCACKMTWNDYGERVRLTKYSNAGEDERYRIKRYLKDNYKSHTYLKYAGTLLVGTNNNLTTVTFDSITISFEGDLKGFSKIVTTGLISPQMFCKYPVNAYRVCCFEELKYLKCSESRRRLTFWCYDSNNFNPLVYLMELTNTNANKSTDIESFIIGSQTTYFASLWVQR